MENINKLENYQVQIKVQQSGKEQHFLLFIDSPSCPCDQSVSIIAELQPVEALQVNLIKSTMETKSTWKNVGYVQLELRDSSHDRSRSRLRDQAACGGQCAVRWQERSRKV